MNETFKESYLGFDIYLRQKIGETSFSHIAIREEPYLEIEVINDENGINAIKSLIDNCNE